MPRISKALRARIISVADGRCEYCLALQELTLATFHLDHILPRSAGGKTVFENLCFSCPLCNQFKQGLWRARDPETGRWVRLFGYPRKAGHSVASSTYREGLMTLTRPWQVIDL